MGGKIFPDGMNVYLPKSSAPEFVKFDIWIDAKKLAKFAEKYERDGYINVELQESKKKDGFYFSLNNQAKEIDDEEEALREGSKAAST